MALCEDLPPSIGKILAPLIILILIMFPLQAKESTSVSCDPDCLKWDAGTIKASIIIKTEITQPKRELLNVKYYGNGTCVPYARERTGIQLFGWAGSFMTQAITAGYSTSSIPIMGGMVITNEGGGHVAVVEDVFGSFIRITEQNMQGLYVISERTFHISSPRIKGYVY